MGLDHVRRPVSNPSSPLSMHTLKAPHKYYCHTIFSTGKFADLLETRQDLKVRILRIYSSAVERKDFPGPKYQTQQALPDNACPEWARPYSLHHLIRQAGNTKVEFVALQELEQKLEDMARNNQIANGKLCNEYSTADLTPLLDL